MTINAGSNSQASSLQLVPIPVAKKNRKDGRTDKSRPPSDYAKETSARKQKSSYRHNRDSSASYSIRSVGEKSESESVHSRIPNESV
jgi:hypothetical protein